MSQDVSPKIRFLLSNQEHRDKQTEVDVALPLLQTRTSALGASFFFDAKHVSRSGTGGTLNRNWLQTLGQQSI